MEPGPMSPADGGPDAGAPIRRVLLVEDEEDIRESLKELLETVLDRVEVSTAANGADGLALLATLSPHLVISDYKMPGMSGLEFLAETRKRAPATPRVLMTAFPDLGIATRAVNGAHIHSFFPKPLDIPKVLQKVEQLLTTEEARRARDMGLARALRGPAKAPSG